MSDLPAPAAGPPAARSGNLARLLAAALAADEPPSRADLAVAVGTTRATASRLADELVAGGLLDEAAPTSRGRGRPGTPLLPGAGVGALGLQVDVDRLVAVLVDLRGEVRAQEVAETDLRGSRPRPTLLRLSRLAARALRATPGLRVVGAGLALPGIVGADGVLLRAPNLGWTDLPVRDLVAPLSGDLAPVVGNEADLAAATVTSTAPGRPGPWRDLVYLSGSTGIGGSVVLDGRPVLGRHGWAGEVGHVTVDPEGPPCACGSTGCLEQYAGARALARAAGLDEHAGTAVVAARARAGDPDAAAAVERAARGLGIALSAVVNVVDVPVVVLGGHLRELGDLLRPTLEATLRRRVLSAAWAAPVVHVTPATAHPAARGAAYGVLGRVVAHPERHTG